MFEFVRRFRKWVMIGTVILVSFAFGITGVVYSVLTPNQSPGEEKIGTYSVSAITRDDKTVSVKRREFESFQRRWNQFLVDHLTGFQMLFGRAMEQGGRMYNMAVRMAMQRAMRGSSFFRFIPYVQSRYQVDFIRNLVFLRSADDALESEVVRLTPSPDEESMKDLDKDQKARKRRRDWSREIIWRLMYFRDLARNAGFSATDQEIRELVRPYLDRSSKGRKRNITYRQFVEGQANMGVDQFETTLKELITILKFLGSISRSTSVDGDALLEGFQEDLGYGSLLVANIDHKRVKRELYSNRRWRDRQRFLELYPRKDVVDSLSAFTSNLGGQENNRRRRSSSDQNEKSFEKRQFAYLYLPLTPYLKETDPPSEDRLRSYYESNKEEFSRDAASGGEEGAGNGKENSEGQEDTDQYRPFESVRAEIREKLHRKRALREADKDLQKLINSTISRKEIRDEPVDFQQIAEQDNFGGRIKFRTSPLLDAEDMTHYLKEKKGVRDAQLEKLKQLIFDRSLGDDGPPGPYLKESIWFKDGAILPRLIRVESNVMTPSFESAGNGAEGTNWTLSDFSDRYPIPSLQLRNVLRWRELERSAKQRASQLQQKLVGQYTRTRDEMWTSNDVYGPPVPPEHAAGNKASKEKQKDATKSQTSAEDVQWPPASFSNDTLEKHVSFRRKKWKRARAAFEQVAQRAGLEVHVTEPFKLEEGPSGVDVQENILNQLRGRRNPRQPGSGQGAELFEPVTGSTEEQSQIAVLFKKLSKSGEDLSKFLDEQRQSKVFSARSSYLKQNVITYIEQANLSLTETSQDEPRPAPEQ